MVGQVPMTGYIYPNVTDCDMITSVNSIAKESNVEIFPNPSEGSFQIDFKENSFQELIISNLLGDIILSEKIYSTNNLTVKNINNGIYILSLVDKDKRKINKKIIFCFIEFSNLRKSLARLYRSLLWSYFRYLIILLQTGRPLWGLIRTIYNLIHEYSRNYFFSLKEATCL